MGQVTTVSDDERVIRWKALQDVERLCLCRRALAQRRREVVGWTVICAASVVAGSATAVATGYVAAGGTWGNVAVAGGSHVVNVAMIFYAFRVRRIWVRDLDDAHRQVDDAEREVQL